MADRRAAAIHAFVLGAVLGYAALRLVAAVGEPDPRTLGPSAHIPYYWRAATAGWWGLLLAAAAWRFPAFPLWSLRTVVAAVLLAVAAAFLVP